MPYHFYKTVRDYHITGKTMFMPTTGIARGGLDPALRNCAGGCTATAQASCARPLSEADNTGVGQCLTGNRSYAEDYATQDNQCLLRITLEDSDLDKLVVSAANRSQFNSLQEAVDASECTAIVTIPPSCIDYLTEARSWQSISTFPNPKPWRGGGEEDW